MKLRAVLAILGVALFISSPFVLAQVDSVIGQFTNSNEETFVGGISGDGRFAVFESRGNLATTNPRNADGNVEIFLFDYAQRQIFQITNTKSVVIDPNRDPLAFNIRVEITNRRPTISNDGRWIAFGSNAVRSRGIDPNAPPDGANPGNFDGNSYNTQAATPCTIPTPSPTATPTPSPTATPTATPTPSATPTPAPTPFNNPLDCDGNLEMWMYEIPAYAPADLTTGEEIPFVDLSAGVFMAVTDTPPSRLPQRATDIAGAFVADDSHDASIDDDGSVIAFVSTRDPVTGANSVPDANDEIFTFVRNGGAAVAGGESKENGVEPPICLPGLSGTGTICQITRTTREQIFDPVYSKVPTISGNGLRVVFVSTGDNPIRNMTGGNNPSTSRNEELFVADLTEGGAPAGVNRQITVTTPLNPGDPVNILEGGRRMSRDGRFIAFDSYADLATEHSGTNQGSFATYLYDYDAPTATRFRRVLPRSDADAEALGGDVSRYPGFTDYDVNGVPSTFVLETRMNILPNGTMPTNEADGLNPTDGRPIQIYRYDLTLPTATALFTRLTKLPLPTAFLASTQPIPSNSASRMAFTLALTEFGTGNPDRRNEGFYLYEPISNLESPASFDLATGASRIPVSASPVPTPSPTATPSPSPTPTSTPTPTPSPTPTPTGTPTPVPTPTPQTPPAVQGVSPGMLAVLTLTPRSVQPIVARTGVGSLTRTFTLPIELSGVTVTINGAACGIKSVTRLINRYEIIFVVPTGLADNGTVTSYPIVANVNGTVSRGSITIVPARPDIFSNLLFPGPGGRALVTNVTNRVHTTEPFTARTIRIRGGVFTASVLRVRVTGVHGAQGGSANDITLRIGGAPPISGTRVVSGGVLVEPGVYTIDFLLPPEINGAGDQPIILQIHSGSTTFTSRLDDTAARISIL